MVKGGDPTALLSTGSGFEAAAIQSTNTSAAFPVLNVVEIGERLITRAVFNTSRYYA